MTLRTAVAQGAELLQTSGTPEPRLTAELLLCHALHCERPYLYAHPEQELREVEWIHYGRWLHERMQGKPLQYITKTQEFYGRPFRVSPDVLIPRPETELLIETVLNRSPHARKIADVGVGSGCVAITLALELNATVFATDISPSALKVAAENAQSLLAPPHDSSPPSPAIQKHDSSLTNPKHDSGPSSPATQEHASNFSFLTTEKDDSDPSSPAAQKHDSAPSHPQSQKHRSEFSSAAAQEHNSDLSSPATEGHASNFSSLTTQKHAPDSSPLTRKIVGRTPMSAADAHVGPSPAIHHNAAADTESLLPSPLSSSTPNPAMPSPPDPRPTVAATTNPSPANFSASPAPATAARPLPLAPPTIQLVAADLLIPIDDSTLDVVVSNPPYIPLGGRPSLQREVRDWEPQLALFAGPAGLDIYRRLIPEAWRVLKPGGLLAVELGHEQADSVSALVINWCNIRIASDLAGIPRVLSCEKPRTSPDDRLAGRNP